MLRRTFFMKTHILAFFLFGTKCHMFSESTGFISFNLSIFKVYYFYDVINCLNINGVRICNANCLGTVTFKKLLAICFNYNSEEKSTKISIPKINPNRIKTNFPARVQF